MMKLHHLVMRAIIGAPGGALIVVGAAAIYGLSTPRTKCAATGAPVALKRPYLVGERGPEFVNRRAGTEPIGTVLRGVFGRGIPGIDGNAAKPTPPAPGELVREIDMAELLRFDAEIARDAAADQAEDW